MSNQEHQPRHPTIGQSVQEQRSKLFGSYKAEWLSGSLYDLFAEPAYFPELTSPSPCILQGGRGTGKTTVLRCMSYEGRLALEHGHVQSIPNWVYYGMYYRVNTNRVTAFSGPELSDERWKRTFAHYVNLVLCDLAVRFLQWYELNTAATPALEFGICNSVALALQVTPARSLKELALNISQAKLNFEAYINNVADAPQIPLSLQGAPLDELFAHLRQQPHFQGKSFFFLLDEYENLQDYQQQVLNTLVKHSGELYSFKIGVRELGLRVRTTLNENEQLISPADYVRIDIAEAFSGDKFDDFAFQVSNERIRRLLPEGSEIDTQGLLPGLTEDREAELLDSDSGPAHQAACELAAVVEDEDRALLEELPLLDKYCLVSWSRAQDLTLQAAWENFKTDRAEWNNRLSNYRHSLLYTLRHGKRGIRKYYCGARVFARMAACNIRYFLELVDQSIASHLAEDSSLDKPIPHEIQTKTAQYVGRKNLSELEGLSVHGGKLTKLVLGLGRVFQIMAADAFGHTPEVNQFHVPRPSGATTDQHEQEVDQLLKAAVMHLALLRTPGSKPMDEADTREYDYMLHPIFSAFFVFTWRRKRKFSLSSDQLLGLVRDHRQTIREILAMQNRSDLETLPDQLRLFGPYFNVSED